MHKHVVSNLPRFSYILPPPPFLSFERCLIFFFFFQSIVTGQAPLRQEAERFRWTDQARLPQEGQDDQEDHPQNGVPEVQVQEAVRHQEMQALRARRNQEAKGSDLLLSEQLVQAWFCEKFVTLRSCFVKICVGGEGKCFGGLVHISLALVIFLMPSGLSFSRFSPLLFPFE
jgi:hypothetical protein